MKKRIIIILFMALLIGVSAMVYFAQKAAENGDMYYSGTLETTDSNLAFQVAGHVRAVYAREGRAVKAGQVLAELDQAEFMSRLDQARAALDRSVKTREQLEDVLRIYTDTLPAEVKRAEANSAIAMNTMLDAKKNSDRYEELFSRGVVSERERDTVRLGYDNARSRLGDASAALKQAKASLGKIDATKKDIESAQAQIDLGRAAVDQA
ncbi:biotin/lipoyl-binding protein, partial [bacterium]|nr:biotin/lipoyl-binding protein [bacterium]